MWWVLQVARVTDEEGKVEQNLFNGASYDEKLSKYDSLEDEGESHMDEALKKFAYFTSYWYNGQAAEEEDFKNIEKAIDGAEEEVEEDTEEKAEEKKESKPKKAKKKKEEKTEEKAEEKVEEKAEEAPVEAPVEAKAQS